jgi:hypothetical protein
VKTCVKSFFALVVTGAALCLPAVANAESVQIVPGSFSIAPNNLQAGAHPDLET